MSVLTSLLSGACLVAACMGVLGELTAFTCGLPRTRPQPPARSLATAGSTHRFVDR